MIQLCGKEAILPLQLLFKSMLEGGIFPDDWKKSNVVPVHEKEYNLMKIYRPMSPLPIFSKSFERLIFNSLFNYFMQNKLFTECQSGFIPGDFALHNSCQLHMKSIKFLTVTQRLRRGEFFLDISKVWNEGLIFKLKACGIDGDLLRLLINYLEDRDQRVVLNGQISSWKKHFSRCPSRLRFGFYILLSLHK